MVPDGGDDGGDDGDTSADDGNDGDSGDGGSDDGDPGDGGTEDGDDSGGGDDGEDTSTDDGDPVEGCPGPDPGFGGAAQVGQPAPHWIGIDSSGAEREMCDFYGKPVMLDLSALWCGACQAFGAFMAGDDGAPAAAGIPQADIQSVLIPFRNLVRDGTIIYITVIIEGQMPGGGVSVSDVAAWENAFGAPGVYIWGDMEEAWWFMVYPSGSGGVPAFIALDHEFNFLTTDPLGGAFSDLLDAYG
jgi:hypothetical protein